MSEIPTPIPSARSVRLLERITHTYIAIALPGLILLISIRLIMTPLFLQLEYTRPGFPDDYFGFTISDRLAYAPYAVDYLLNDAGIAYLGDLRFPDGKPMYNARELKHMRDVKTVTRVAYLIALIGGVIAGSAALYLWRSDRTTLWMTLFHGSMLTLAVIVAVVVVAVINWDFFFTGFHSIFFASGTWRFEYSDTLIRLFPEQFWFDTALTIGVLTSLSALFILILAWHNNRKT
jgi:integral membrane protein (TIGR01906 family)